MLTAVLFVSGCAGTTPTPKAPERAAAPAPEPTERLPEPTAPLVARAELVRGAGREAGAAAFFLARAGHVFAVTVAHPLAPTAPAIDAIELHDGRRSDAPLLARIDATWGLAGDAGADVPVLDLRSDRLLARVETLPAGFGALELDPRPSARTDERVWLARPDAAAPMGYTPLAGTVSDADSGFVEVVLDAAPGEADVAGAPVVALEGGHLIGMVSRIARVGEHSVLWLVPAAALGEAAAAGREVPLGDAVASARPAAAGPTRLTFAWPDRVQARVRRERLRRGGRDETRSGASFQMTAQRDSDGYLIGYTDFELEGGAEGEAGQLSRIANMGPSYRVALDGQFGAIVDLDRLLTALEGMLAEIPEAQRELVRERFVNPELLTQMAVSDWNQRVASWAGAELDAGDTYQLDAEVAMPVLGAEQVPTKSFFELTRDVPCNEDDVARRCVRIDMLTMPDPASLRELLSRFVERVAPDEDAANRPALGGLRLRSRVQLVTDPDTLLPHRMREEKSTRFQLAGDDGPVLESYELQEERYRY